MHCKQTDSKLINQSGSHSVMWLFIRFASESVSWLDARRMCFWYQPDVLECSANGNTASKPLARQINPSVSHSTLITQIESLAAVPICHREPTGVWHNYLTETIFKIGPDTFMVKEKSNGSYKQGNWVPNSICYFYSYFYSCVVC